MHVAFPSKIHCFLIAFTYQEKLNYFTENDLKEKIISNGQENDERQQKNKSKQQQKKLELEQEQQEEQLKQQEEQEEQLKQQKQQEEQLKQQQEQQSLNKQNQLEQQYLEQEEEKEIEASQIEQTTSQQNQDKFDTEEHLPQLQSNQNLTKSESLENLYQQITTSEKKQQQKKSKNIIYQEDNIEPTKFQTKNEESIQEIEPNNSNQQQQPFESLVIENLETYTSYKNFSNYIIEKLSQKDSPTLIPDLLTIFYKNLNIPNLELSLFYIQALRLVKDIIIWEYGYQLEKEFEAGSFTQQFLDSDYLQLLINIAQYNKEHKELQRGQYLFGEEEGQKQLGFRFFICVLECIMAWGIIYYETKFMNYFDELINEGVTFPDRFVYFKSWKINLSPSIEMSIEAAYSYENEFLEVIKCFGQQYDEQIDQRIDYDLNRFIFFEMKLQKLIVLSQSQNLNQNQLQLQQLINQYEITVNNLANLKQAKDTKNIRQLKLIYFADIAEQSEEEEDIPEEYSDENNSNTKMFYFQNVQVEEIQQEEKPLSISIINQQLKQNSVQLSQLNQQNQQIIEIINGIFCDIYTSIKYFNQSLLSEQQTNFPDQNILVLAAKKLYTDSTYQTSEYLTAKYQVLLIFESFNLKENISLLQLLDTNFILTLSTVLQSYLNAKRNNEKKHYINLLGVNDQKLLNYLVGKALEFINRLSEIESRQEDMCFENIKIENNFLLEEKIYFEKYFSNWQNNNQEIEEIVDIQGIRQKIIEKITTISLLQKSVSNEDKFKMNKELQLNLSELNEFKNLKKSKVKPNYFLVMIIEEKKEYSEFLIILEEVVKINDHFINYKKRILDFQTFIENISNCQKIIQTYFNRQSPLNNKFFSPSLSLKSNDYLELNEKYQKLNKKNLEISQNYSQVKLTNQQLIEQKLALEKRLEELTNKLKK